MSHEWLSLDEVARQIGRDARDMERLASRGQIPAHKRVATGSSRCPKCRTGWNRKCAGYTDSELAEVEQLQQSTEVNAEIPLTSLLKLETVAVPLEARTKRSVLEGLIDVAGRTWHVWEPATVLRAVIEREDLCSTAFGNGVAVPHPRQPLPGSLGESVVAFGRTFSGVPFGGARGELTDLYFLVLCRDTKTHLQVLAHIARILQLPGFLDALRQTDSPQPAYDLIRDAEQQV